MDKFDKIVNIGLASAFGAAGTAALIGAVFFGATHQYAIALIGAVAATLLIAEVRREERKNTQQTTQ